MRMMSSCPFDCSAAPVSAPRNMANTATARRPSFDISWPWADVSATMPVTVIVSTVVGKSGTASRRAVEFWMPIAGAISTISIR